MNIRMKDGDESVNCDDDLVIVGRPEELEALGHLMIAKAKIGKNLSATYINQILSSYHQKIRIVSDEEYIRELYPNGKWEYHKEIVD